MRQAIDDEKFNAKPGAGGLVQLDPAKPPTKAIPFQEFPRVVYKHPREDFRVIEHRNTLHEVVDLERVPSEHIARLVADEAELKQALADGFVKEPYIQKAPPDPNANLYEQKPQQAKAKQA